MSPSSIVRACWALTCDGVEFRLGDTVWAPVHNYTEGPKRIETSEGTHSVMYARGTNILHLYDRVNGYYLHKIENLFCTEAAAWAFYAGQLADRRDKIDKRLTEIARKIDGLAALVR